MTQDSRASSVTVADPDAHRAVLEALLEEYHAWLASEAREWAAEQESVSEDTEDATDASEPALPDSEYDPATEAIEDRRTLADPGKNGRGFLAFYEGEPAGVVLLYGVSGEIAELKRLYVRPTHRGEGIGRALCRAAIAAAGELGYRTAGLTTPPWSEEAHALYEELDFAYTEPYPETTLPEHLHENALFMQRTLQPEV